MRINEGGTTPDTHLDRNASNESLRRLLGEMREASLKQLFTDENLSDLGVQRTMNRNSSHESLNNADSNAIPKMRILSQKAHA
jgi:hypothetical protein